MTMMHYRPLGRSGLMVSAVGLGCNNFGREGTGTESLQGTDAVISAAIDSGINFFDTADIYGSPPGTSETLMGKALKGKRDKIVLATKFGHLNFPAADITNWGAKGSRRYVRQAVETSLRRLQTEWIDLYQLHTPDPITPMDETIGALDELIADGKIRYIGHSNFAGWQIAEAEYLARIGNHSRFISAQNEYNLISRGVEDEVLPAVRQFGLGFLPFFPLYNGLLTGKYSRRGGPAGTRIMDFRPHLLENAPWDAIETLEAFCETRGITMLQATFAWLLAQPQISSVIAGATSPAQIIQNAEAASAWTPAQDEAEWIGSLFLPVKDSSA